MTGDKIICEHRFYKFSVVKGIAFCSICGAIENSNGSISTATGEIGTSLIAEDKKKCAWEEVENGDYWEASCGLCWCFEDGRPKENGIKYCPKCGKRVKVKK